MQNILLRSQSLEGFSSGFQIFDQAQWHIPVNILGFCKRLLGNIWQRLKMVGMKTICNRMFLKRFKYTVY